ncbi:hypothetical protein [Pseudomonas sp. TWP3-2]|uniref:hypothetical protein n=1 Tax=Pseudomonas sp. TWP3-2 TaxID=2804574 RepID=UPI003CF7794A
MESQNSLKFLDDLFIDPGELLRKAWWLLSDFDAPVWTISLQYKKPKTLDWRVRLNDNSLLTDPKNHHILKSFKYFLTGSTEYPGQKTRAARVAVTTDRGRLTNSIYILDYLLLNAERFELARYGLAGLNEGDLKSILHQFASTQSVADSIYTLPSRAAEFCLKLVSETPPEIIRQILIDKPSIADVSIADLENCQLDVSPLLIPSIRAALFHHGFYKGYSAGGFHIRMSRLTHKLYKNTLKKHLNKARIYILSFYPQERAYRREFPGVPVAGTGNEGITKATYFSFRRRLYSMGVLHTVGADAPLIVDIQTIENYMINLVPCQRFRLVPSDIIFDQFKEAVEFHFKYGRLIIDGFCRLAKHCILNNIDMIEISHREVQRVIGPELTSLGVKQLGLACNNISQCDKTGRKPRKQTKETFFTRLRANHGLIELVEIYVGCVEFVVGALMSRRSSELISLPPFCLDKTQEWLILDLAKMSKGLFGERDTQARPIDRLGVKMIRELQRMQRYLKRIGYIEKYYSLFAAPSQGGERGLPEVTVASFYRNLDLMFDYFEIPTDSNGNRYYIRQHQLRRFFTLLFFHFYGEGGVNAIRWMLGHADIEHIWHYITETIDGAALRGARSQYIIEEMMKSNGSSYNNLAKMLMLKFGVDTFMLVDEEEADSYIQDELEKGNISIEPVFFEDETGKRMKIVVKILNIVD